MSERRYLQLSVHQFVDFLFRVGDIDDRIYNQSTMQMGSKLHGAYQEKQGNSYHSEVALSGKIEIEEGTIFLQGRADGIITGGIRPVVDEIKTCIIPVERFYAQQKQWHLSQAVVYAYLYLLGTSDKEIEISLTYLSQVDSEDKMVKGFAYKREEIFSMVEDYAKQYFSFFAPHHEHLVRRDASIEALSFPFAKFRKGQKELSKYAFGAIKNHSILFCEAPTGIGKTLSVLFPAVKSFKQHRVDRVFYLTAKGTGSLAAYEALGKLYESGFEGRDSTLVGKEKICLCPGCRCNPSSCPYAEGYYSKIKEVIKEVSSNTNRFDEQTILHYAEKYRVCPFEMQLDLSLFADVIVCDYNYLLDPMVYLERYFEEGVDTSTDVFLLDEAHNLIDRGKDMYSATLSFEKIARAKKALKGPSWKKLRKSLKTLMDYLDELGIDDEPKPLELPKSALLSLFESIKRSRTKEEGIEESLPSEYSDFSRDLAKFKMILEQYYCDCYICYGGSNAEGKFIKLHCLDASRFIRERLQKGKGAVLFSATLSPMDYYEQSILGEKNYPSLILPSPFKKEQMGLFVVPNVSIKYKDRKASYPDVARILSTYVNKMKGNIFLFFPSYEYLDNILPLLELQDADVLVQSKSMTPRERKEMLDAFLPAPERTTVGCLILGGAFGEGVDLVSDRLTGVAIVGVGMPTISFESDLVRAYYDEKEGKGFAYAYLYPGLNKVAQALGRLIRSEEDFGTALLIDSRYAYGEYRAMLDRLHGEYRFVYDEEEELDCLDAFTRSH